MHKNAEVLHKEAIEILKNIDAKVLKAKDRMNIPPQDMPSQEADERIKNMSEVTYGYSEEQALVEAERCLQCKNAPCIKGCPVSIDIPGFIIAITEKKFDESIDIIKKSSLLPAICGRVCPRKNSARKNALLARH